MKYKYTIFKVRQPRKFMLRYLIVNDNFKVKHEIELQIMMNSMKIVLILNDIEDFAVPALGKWP